MFQLAYKVPWKYWVGLIMIALVVLGFVMWAQKNQDLIDIPKYLQPKKKSKKQLKHDPIEDKTPPTLQLSDERAREKHCRKCFEKIYKKRFARVHPDWLRNPMTGRKLELDGYCEEIRVAFEHNGQQHYVYPNAFHRNETEFWSQRARDRIKKLICETQDVWLIIIPYDVPFKEIDQYIRDHLPPQEHFSQLKRQAEVKPLNLYD